MRNAKIQLPLWLFGLIGLLLGGLLLGAGASIARADDGDARARYLVFVEPGEKDAFLPAAQSLATFHGAEVVRFESSDLDQVLETVRRHQPDHVAFVLPPSNIDVDLSHDILELAVRVDDDPFVDFEYGFITGRDGAAASAFVSRILRAHDHDYGRRASMFGSWEGQMGPMRAPMTAFAAMGFEAKSYYVRVHDEEPKRIESARNAFQGMKGSDALLFFSHGYPDEMSFCFRAQDLRDWKVDLWPSILVNCACYNGAPGRWYAPGRGGPEDKGRVDPKVSVALQILDAGVPAYVAGVDPWHGLLANQVFDLIVGEGMRLGEATKRMFDRLALEFWPERIDFPPTAEHRLRFSGEGTNNRRHNGGGMILFGDPAFAPFERDDRRAYSDLAVGKDGSLRVRMGTKPLVDGGPGEDFMIPMNVVLDYYSVKSAQNLMQQLGIELHRVVRFDADAAAVPALTVSKARCGKEDVRTKEPQCLFEERRDGRYLHVRLPLAEPWFPPGLWPGKISQHGLSVELEGRLGES